MPTDTITEFRKMAADQLAERERELRDELFKIRSGEATEKVKDTTKARKLKRDIARILTLRREAELKKA